MRTLKTDLQIFSNRLRNDKTILQQIDLGGGRGQLHLRSRNGIPENATDRGSYPAKTDLYCLRLLCTCAHSCGRDVTDYFAGRDDFVEEFSLCQRSTTHKRAPARVSKLFGNYYSERACTCTRHKSLIVIMLEILCVDDQTF